MAQGRESKEHSGQIQPLLKKIKDVIKRWNKGSNGNIFKRIEDAKRKLADLGADNDEVVVTKMQLEELNLTKDNMFKQKARVLWLMKGDRNAKFFHQAIQRRRSS